jgi:serine/threonine protein kinase
MEKLPSKKDFLDQLEKEVNFSMDNPESKYEMLKEIGMGGFARIYLCRNIETKEFLALKYMKACKKKEVE